MLKELKMQSFKKNLLLIVLLLAASVGLLWATGFGAFHAIVGPKPLADMDPAEIEGVYVEAEVPFIYDWYAYTSQRNSSTKQTKTVSKEYIIDMNEEYYIGLFMPQTSMHYAETLLEESTRYYNRETNEIGSGFIVRGIVERMDAESLGFYHEVVGYDALDAEYQAQFLPYYIKSGYLGNFDVPATWFFTALAGVLLILALYRLIRALTGGYQAPIKRFCAASLSPETTLAEICADYEQTEPISKIRFGNRYIIFNVGALTHVMETDDLVWAYRQTTQHRTNGIPSGKTHAVVLRTRAKKKYVIGMSEKKVCAIMEYIAQNLKHVVLGFQPDLEKLYLYDMESFTKLPEQLTAQPAPPAEAYAGDAPASSTSPIYAAPRKEKDLREDDLYK